MPYKTEKIKLLPHEDRRRKLTEKEKERIKETYKPYIIGAQKLANKYKVSKRLIQLIVDQEKAQKVKEQYKQRRLDGRYKPSKEKWAATMREHRKYKHETINKRNIKN